MKRDKAQTIIEYSILLGVAVAVFITMRTYLSRGIQAGIRISADQLGEQKEGLPYTDPREGAIQAAHSKPPEPKTAKPSWIEKSVFVGGAQSTKTYNDREAATDSVATSMDDGKYYVPKQGEKWELHRVGEN